MVKGIIKGFAFTIGKIIAFLFISLVIGTLLFKIDDIDISKVPFKQLIMNLVFVNGHALTKEGVLYTGVYYNNTSGAQRYLSITDNTLTRGTEVNHVSGAYPTALALLIRDTTYSSNSKYILSVNSTICMNNSSFGINHPFMSKGTWSNSNDNLGSATTIVQEISSTNLPGNKCFNIQFNGEFSTGSSNYTAIIAFMYFNEASYVRYIKLNSFTTTRVSSDNSDIINNQNQNTTVIVNNQNENTENIINNQNENTQEIIDTITDDNLPDVINSGGGGGTYFDTISQSSNTPISDILLLPINLINSFVNNLSSSCSTINLGSLYNHQLTLPCINLETYLGSNLWGLIDVCSCFFMIYNIFMACISFFEKWTSLNDTFDELYYVKERK